MNFELILFILMVVITGTTYLLWIFSSRIHWARYVAGELNLAALWLCVVALTLTDMDRHWLSMVMGQLVVQNLFLRVPRNGREPANSKN